jgi:thioredoxin reductase (NADPH)
VPLERSLSVNSTETAYLKCIVRKDENETVIGLHYIGPTAGEVIGGYALAMKLGLSRRHLIDSIGVHPTVSEEFFNLEVTKRSGKEYRKTGC